jgi:hypothetical protein
MKMRVNKFLYQRFLWLPLLVLLVGCKGKAVKPPSLSTIYPVEELREDFQQLVAITRQHPALHAFTDEVEYRQLVRQQAQKLNQPLAITDFYRVLMPLVTKIGCGHSALDFERIISDSSATVLPLRLVFHQGRGYVLGDYSPAARLTAGTEITRINGKSIPALLAQLETYISTDGNNASLKKEQLNVLTFNALLAIEENFPKVYTLSYRLTEKDSIRQIVIPEVAAQTFSKTYRATVKPDPELQFGMDTAKRVAILTVKSFNFYNQVDSFKRFVDDSFTKIKRAKINQLVLDLRYNGGGDPFCSAYLLTYLVQKPVPYFAHPYPQYERLAQPMPLPRNRFTGPLYVLINGFCSSSTGHLCALLKSHGRGEFIGTETHGTYTCNDGSETFYLTNTGLEVRMARSIFQVAATGLPRFRGILPDNMVEPVPADWLTGNDPVMQFALQRIEESLTGQTTL